MNLSDNNILVTRLVCGFFRKVLPLSFALSALLVPTYGVLAATPALVTRLQGQILLQVQSHGEAWYVNPKDQKRYYMKDGAAAYQMMRSFGQGISEADYTKASSGNASILKRIKGLIVLRVSQHGEAYYVNPKTLALTYLKDGDAAYALMRQQGQGVASTDLEKINMGTVSSVAGAQTPPSNGAIQSNIGDTEMLATISVKVNSVRTAQQTTDTLGTATAKPGSKFIIVDLSVTNITNTAITFSSGLALIDQKGRQFTDYSDTIGKIDNYLLMRTLAPSIEERGVSLYEVPNDATSFKLETMKVGSDQIYDILIPESAIQPASTPPQIPVATSTPAPTSVYCTTSSGDCAGFKIKIDFDENPATCDVGLSSCNYYDTTANTKKIFYLIVRGDTVDGKVVLQNLNSGTEQDYDDITSGRYNSSTGAIDFTYGYYLYPNIQVDFRYIEHVGVLTGNRFSGTYQYYHSSPTPASGAVTYMPITAEDKIPRTGCTIKGDTNIYSGDRATYYLPSSASYSSVHLVQKWFCSEQDATIAGYQKALR